MTIPSINFITPGTFDIHAALLMGVSVKTPGAIGFFGTGLKYALATILRNKQKVIITQGEVRSLPRVLTFTTSPLDFKGRTFERISFTDSATGEETTLGFTTELGKNWTLPMAFRELESNTRDEGGRTSEGDILPLPGTTITVTGTEFLRVYQHREAIFTSAEVLYEDSSIRVRNGQGDSLFYRGVNVGKLPSTSLFTYDLLENLELTEDRTVRQYWRIDDMVTTALAKCTDPELLKTILCAKKPFFEADFAWNKVPLIHPPMKSALLALQDSNFLSPSARGWAETCKVFDKPTWTPTKLQLAMLTRADTFLSKAGLNYHTRFPRKFVKLPAFIHAQALDGEILLSPLAFSCGTKHLAHALLEEWMHLELGYGDCTRELQSHLFKTLLSLVEELSGEPL